MRRTRTKRVKAMERKWMEMPIKMKSKMAVKARIQKPVSRMRSMARRTKMKMKKRRMKLRVRGRRKDTGMRRRRTTTDLTLLI